MTTDERYARLMEDIAREFPRFRLLQKSDSWFQRLIDLGLRIGTAGAMNHYMTHYQTTIGSTVYVTDNWEQRSTLDRYIVMRHERVHLRQFRDLSLPGMTFLYLLIPVPVGAAFFRARLEQAAYAETIRATAEVYGRKRVLEPTFRAAIVAQFLGPSYGWMWPFRLQVERWYDGVTETLESPQRGPEKLC